jgi:DNA-binding PadR family transcriptional regulator
MAALNGSSMYGYEIMALIHREFGVLLSPGTLYPLLHSLENKELIISNTDGSKIVYKISMKGKEKYQETIIDLNFIFEKLSVFIRNHKEDTLQIA